MAGKYVQNVVSLVRKALGKKAVISMDTLIEMMNLGLTESEAANELISMERELAEFC